MKDWAAIEAWGGGGVQCGPLGSFPLWLVQRAEMNERLSLPARDSEEFAAQIYDVGQACASSGNTLLTVLNKQVHTNSSVAAIDGRRV